MSFKYWVNFIVKRLWILVLFPLLASSATAYVTAYHFEKTFESVSTLYIASKSDFSQLLSKLENVKKLARDQASKMEAMANIQKSAGPIPGPQSQLQKEFAAMSEKGKEQAGYVDSMIQDLKSVMVPAGFSELMAGELLVKDYKELMVSRKVIDEVIRRLNLKDAKYMDVVGKVAINARNDTRIIEIRAQDKDPIKARDLSNTLGKVFSEKLKEIAGADNAKVLDEALVENKPVKPDLVKNIMLAFVAGVVAAVGLIFLMEFFDSRVRSKEDVERHLKLAVLGSLSTPSGIEPSVNDKSSLSEYRVLRTNIINTKIQKNAHNTLMVTKCGTSEENGRISLSLSMAMAKSGMNVLCISNEVKNSARSSDNKKEASLAEAITGKASFDKVISNSGFDGLHTAYWGGEESELGDVICHPHFENIIKDLSSQFDWVILDAAPFKETADKVHLASMADGALIAAEAGYTKLPELASLKSRFEEADAKILGVVLESKGKA